MAAEPTTRTLGNVNAIPDLLKGLPQWVLWKYEARKGKLTKVPYHPRGKRASATDPNSWVDFDQALGVYATNAGFNGIGFVVTKGVGIVGVDLDHCLDLDTGVMEPWARNIIAQLNTYTEVTPSSQGLRSFLVGKLPAGGRKKGNIEMYQVGRFLTVTGNHLPGMPLTIEARQAAITAVHADVFGPPDGARADPRPPFPGASLDDADLLAKARTAANGDKFSHLWDGDIASYASQSEADLALCSYLAFWTGGVEPQMDRLFRQSGLYRPKWDEPRGAQTYGQQTIARALAGVSEFYQSGHPSGNGPGRDSREDSADQDTPHLTDVGNSRRLVAAHGLDLRYCWPWEKWLVWNGTHWAEDTTGGMYRRARDVPKRLFQLAARLSTKASQASVDGSDQESGKLADQAESVLKWAKTSENRTRIEAMIALARSEPGIPVQPEQLDTDPWALNVLNGTINLKTGQLLPHQREHLLTRLIPVAYNPDAGCPRFLAFLDWAMQGNQSLVDYLKRAIGYALNGLVREHVLFIFYGTGRNGKSTFLDFFIRLLGDYAIKATTELFIERRSDSHPTQIMDLFGKRLAAAIETEEGRRLSGVFVKEATGGDPIRGRRMREDTWQYWPSHTIFLATNHKPVVRDTSEAMWRRLKLIPWRAQVSEEEKDTALPDKLWEEREGILTWAVQGHMEWLEHGLGEPAVVARATASYRSSQDLLGAFLQDYCIEDPECQTLATDLYHAYRKWCEQHGEREQTQTRFGESLAERGFTRDRENTARRRTIWRGLRVRSDVLEGLEPLEPISGMNHNISSPREINREMGSKGFQGFQSKDLREDQEEGII